MSGGKARYVREDLWKNHRRWPLRGPGFAPLARWRARGSSSDLPFETGVRAYLVYCLLEDDAGEPLLAAVATETEAVALESELRTSCPQVSYEEHVLQGHGGPFMEWPTSDTVHLVSAGGIANDGTIIDCDPVGVAVFADLPSAEAYVRRHEHEDFVIRTVRLGERLSIDCTRH